MLNVRNFGHYMINIGHPRTLTCSFLLICAVSLIIDQRVLFYSNNLCLLPPKPKLSFRYLKQGIQEFHRKYVLAPADKAANNVVVV